MKTYDTFQVMYHEFYTNYNTCDNLEKVEKAWEKCFKTILKNQFGFNKQARKECFDWGKAGFNWEALHVDESKEFDHYRQLFFSDVHYCSDRLDFNRLLRCHHLFQMMMEKSRQYV